MTPLRIHHIGIVVSNMKKAMTFYQDLGFLVDPITYADTYQSAQVGKVTTASGVLIELLYSTDKSRLIHNHVCFEVKSIDLYLEYLQKKKLGYRVSEKTPSVFAGRPVCFFATKDKQVFELIETQ